MRNRAKMISVILLAAGQSKRMGKPKQLLSLGRSTVLEQTVDNFLGSEADEIIVVVGHRAKEASSLVASRPVRVVVNQAYSQGMSTSIVAGLGAVSDKAQGVLIALVDQPFVDSKTINYLLEAFCAHDRGITIPVYQGRRGHPVIFAIKYKEELLRIKGDIGGREIIDRHSEDVMEVAVNCEGILLDMDTVESYDLRMKSVNE